MQAQDRPGHLLSLKNIRKTFGGIRALKGVSLSLDEGEVLAAAKEKGCGAAMGSTYPSRRSGLALILTSASRVARIVSASSSLATNRPDCRYAPSLRSWIR